MVLIVIPQALYIYTTFDQNTHFQNGCVESLFPAFLILVLILRLQLDIIVFANAHISYEEKHGIKVMENHITSQQVLNHIALCKARRILGFLKAPKVKVDNN